MTTSTTDADRTLFDRLKVGEDEAFTELLETNIGRLLAVARRITRSAADAEDVVQEAFLSAFKAIADFDGRSSLSTWLHRITVNAALMRQRRKDARPETALESLLPEFDGGRHRTSPTPWIAVTDGGERRIEQQEAVWQALLRLPEAFRTVVQLRDIEGMESKAVAEQLGISDALVRQRLHRGRQALLTLLTPVMGDAP